MTRVSSVAAPLLALLGVLLLAVLPSSVEGASAAQRVQVSAIGVRVVNEAGMPVPGALVVLLNADGKKVAWRHTNHHGRCHFAPVKPGDYLVRAARPGQGKGQEKVTAEDGKLIKATVHLKKQ